MAFQEYQVTAAGHKKVQHNGVLAHQGRLLTMDAASAITAGLVTRGLLTTTLTTTVHDATGAGPSQEGWQTYTVQASGNGRIQFGTSGAGSVLTTGQTLKLDPTEEPALTLAGRGWIA